MNRGARWESAHLATVDQLLALALHPSLPVVYGVSGVGDEGFVHAWDVSATSVLTLTETPSGGSGPCHLAVDPDARMLVVANYGTSTLAVWSLAEDGSLSGEGELIELGGGSVDLERQDTAHPHQVVFNGDLLYVVDLGADVVRTLEVSEPGNGVATLTPVMETAVPAGTGPRHLVVLPGGDVALSGELASTVLTGWPGDCATEWLVAPSTERTGSARCTSSRNFPGDIQCSTDGQLGYLANRGYDTIATFALGAGTPRLIAELDSGVKWPQHLLLAGDELLVAGQDSSLVVAMPLVGGVPGGHRVLFECEGAAWLLPTR
jgi:6-phosphogluconolactonase (cycloisomerase 2 family)